MCTGVVSLEFPLAGSHSAGLKSETLCWYFWDVHINCTAVLKVWVHVWTLAASDKQVLSCELVWYLQRQKNKHHRLLLWTSGSMCSNSGKNYSLKLSHWSVVITCKLKHLRQRTPVLNSTVNTSFPHGDSDIFSLCLSVYADVNIESCICLLLIKGVHG